jgi:hypothetical protein
MRRQIHGVDFSGASDAGRRIWIASGELAGEGLRLDSCRPAEALPGSGRAREPCFAALRAFVAAEARAVFALDFPFALPAAMMPKGSWEAFALTFEERHADAEAFLAACRAAGEGRELWRATDRETKTPFSAYNLRIYRQTYYGIRDLLAPLVAAGRACVLPMQPPAPDRAWLLEICPAATLKQMGLYRSYKGVAPGRRESREHILTALEATGGLFLASRALHALLLDDPGGDALDSAVAAFTAARVLRRPEALAAALDPVYAREGYVYLPPSSTTPGFAPSR